MHPALARIFAARARARALLRPAQLRFFCDRVLSIPFHIQCFLTDCVISVPFHTMFGSQWLVETAGSFATIESSVFTFALLFA